MKIRKLDRRHQGRIRVEWMLDYYASGKRVRRWFKTKTDAEAELDALRNQKRNCGEAWVDLAPEERADLMTIYREAQKEGIALRTVWEAYKSGKLDASPTERRTLKQAITETIEWRRTENLRERYLTELESYLRKFAVGREELLVDKLGVADLEQWFANRKEALTTRKSNMGRLGSMFDVCFRRSYIKDNPMLRMSSPKIEGKPAGRWTPSEAKNLLLAARKRKASLAYFVLGLFAGIRPEELTALTWAAVDLKGATVNIGAEISKVRKQRIVPLHKTAVEWLRPLADKAKPEDMIAPPEVTLRRHRRALREHLGKWPQDVLRHTAASYLLCLHEDAAKVAHMLGNSVRILETNYKTPVAAKDCKAFWNLTPANVKPVKEQKV